MAQSTDLEIANFLSNHVIEAPKRHTKAQILFASHQPQKQHPAILTCDGGYANKRRFPNQTMAPNLPAQPDPSDPSRKGISS